MINKLVWSNDEVWSLQLAFDHACTALEVERDRCARLQRTVETLREFEPFTQHERLALVSVIADLRAERDQFQTVLAARDARIQDLIARIHEVSDMGPKPPPAEPGT